MFTGEAITFGRLDTWTLTFHYEKTTDTLTIRAPWVGEARWVELPDGVRVRVDAQTGEAAEFRVTALRKFLAARPDLEPLWEQVKPAPITLRRRENTPFIARFLDHVKQLAYQREKQIVPSKL